MKYSLVNVLIIGALVIGAVLLASWILVSVAPDVGCPMIGKTPQYWSFAPNGEYEVLFCVFVDENRVFNSTTVFFPLCPSYGGQLHGEFNVSKDLVLPRELKYREYKLFNETQRILEGWILVTLENNIIVRARDIEEIKWE